MVACFGKPLLAGHSEVGGLVYADPVIFVLFHPYIDSLPMVRYSQETHLHMYGMH
jgi:hypothetical protein